MAQTKGGKECGLKNPGKIANLSQLTYVVHPLFTPLAEDVISGVCRADYF
jgi:hypothetical protein